LTAARKEHAKDRGYSPTETEYEPSNLYDWSGQTVKKVTASKDPFSLSKGIYKKEKLKGQKTCPFCFSTNSAIATHCENCNGSLRGVPTTIKPQQADAKKEKPIDARPTDVLINPSVQKSAQANLDIKPINPSKTYSDPHVETETVDEDLDA
jgi:hypothetical protein